MPAWIRNQAAGFAAWRSRKNREKADAIMATATHKAAVANKRARWWNDARTFACGLGRWPGMPFGREQAHG